MQSGDARSLVGCCGLFCGLCEKYQSQAPSRCLGCRLGEQHSWCSIWSCCVKKHGFETCAECGDVFHCPVFVRRKVAEWIPAADNLRRLRDVGLEAWLGEQEERQALLESLLQDYNEGRSMRLYCRFCARMSIDSIEEAVGRAESGVATEEAGACDIKARAALVRSVMKNMASICKVSLA